jgi:hypothetical protein
MYLLPTNNGSTNVYNQPQTPQPAQFIDNTTNIIYNFPFNIDSATWNYQLNMQSYSTIGGRVKQLLSVQLTTLIIQGEAGSRANLIKLYNNFKTMQDNQNQKKVSMTFLVPSKSINYRVWLEQMQIGWDVTTVTYPYYMSLEADFDINGVASAAINSEALNQVVNGSSGEIGFSSVWTGFSSPKTNVNLPQ